MRERVQREGQGLERVCSLRRGFEVMRMQILAQKYRQWDRPRLSDSVSTAEELASCADGLVTLVRGVRGLRLASVCSSARARVSDFYPWCWLRLEAMARFHSLD